MKIYHLANLAILSKIALSSSKRPEVKVSEMQLANSPLKKSACNKLAH
jgi:hypothetical protein